ncbi:hypothetical protein EAI89_13880 [Eubacterium sp. am_0171]|uniref:Uncharacterized protein n=1 Tax=Hungatella hathewayi TaxID=154046 RepID=A0A3E2WYE8_9FIRM|nr:hypothetical protein [Faecalicatena contorta]RGC33346.1 hypothetical protein DWX41_07015 [Hungatella hathewayi]RYT15760.1 hypothetical protein EAI89_13880 [Eubacterium sp. am_0171]
MGGHWERGRLLKVCRGRYGGTHTGILAAGHLLTPSNIKIGLLYGTTDIHRGILMNSTVNVGLMGLACREI